jgi:polyisoprenoid-binding protein YceI
MKFVKLLIALVIGAAIGFGGGFYIGKEAGFSQARLEIAPPPDEFEVAQPVPEKNGDDPGLVGEAVEAVKEAVTGTDAVTFEITPNMQSAIMFTGFKEVAGQKMGMEGGFANFSGSITVSPDAPEQASAEVSIDIASLFTTNNILTKVLKDKDWFQAEKFPQATFKTIEIAKEGNLYLVSGALTMKDKTKGIRFPVRVEFTDKGLRVKASDFKINRKTWDLGYDDFEDALILKEAIINFDILAEAE